MAVMSGRARMTAALIAMIALLGLAVQFHAVLARQGSVALTAWSVLRYFTIIANLLVAMIFTGVALGWKGPTRPFVLGGATLAILLVGVVYGLLLNGLDELSGGDRLADLVLHKVAPVLVPIWWLTFAPKGGLAWRDPWLWAVLPLIYFGYGLARGALEGVYPYPFIDLAALGWTRTLAHALAIAAGFVASGFAIVWLDGRLARLKLRVSTVIDISRRRTNPSVS
jgi:hypothetical protein